LGALGPNGQQQTQTLDADDSEADKPFQERYEDEDSWAFWDEQKKPTRGFGGKLRDKVAEPLPDPLPSLTPPPDDEELEEEDQRQFGDQGAKDEFLFNKAYGKEEPRITDVDGKRCEVPKITTFEEAADELNLQPFLRVSLAQRRFFLSHLCSSAHCHSLRRAATSWHAPSRVRERRQHIWCPCFPPSTGSCGSNLECLWRHITRCEMGERAENP
jgi:hypothetical protein